MDVPIPRRSAPARPSFARALVGRFSSGGLRLAAYGLIGATAAVLLGVLLWRGRSAGVDALAYWLAARTWIAGGDPYSGSCPLCYAYAPWAVPIFAPWAALPWDWAFGLLRATTLVGLGWSVAWAARRRPVVTALAFLALSVPIGINLDTGNITLPLVLVFWATSLADSRWAGIAWGLAAGMKWITLPLWFLLSRPARRWGAGMLGVTVVASLVLLPATIEQARTVIHMDRPLPIDYLVVLWGAVPWLWREPVATLRRCVARAAWLDAGWQHGVRMWTGRGKVPIGRPDLVEK